MIPYGKQSISQNDIDEVIKTLKSDWLTQGPAVAKFEQDLANYCGSKYAVVASNGTVALQAAYFAADLKPGDEVITSPITFPATSNAAIWQGGKPVFVDIDETGNIDVEMIEKHITKNTKVIAPIDYTGRPVNLSAIFEIAKNNNLIVVEDACQALGGSYYGQKIGSLSDLTVFSFHPVKTITTGEGGAILTNNEKFYKRLKLFVNHGISRDSFIYSSEGPWYFEAQELGINCRLTDFQSALGSSQLLRADMFVKKRRELANNYLEAFKDCENIKLPLPDNQNEESAWHLFVIQLKNKHSNRRAEIFKQLRDAGIAVQVHHIPVHLHPYYQGLGYAKGICPKAEKFYESIISLPLYPDLTSEQQLEVIEKVKEFTK